MRVGVLLPVLLLSMGATASEISGLGAVASGSSLLSEFSRPSHSPFAST